jgi:hypothetical protein
MLPKINSRAPELKPNSISAVKSTTRSARPVGAVAKAGVHDKSKGSTTSKLPLVKASTSSIDKISKSHDTAEIISKLDVVELSSVDKIVEVIETQATELSLDTMVTPEPINSVDLPIIPEISAITESLDEFADQNGQVQIVYGMYKDMFPIVAGSMTQETIDEVYCLTFVMPDCRIHLSEQSPTDKTRLGNEGVEIQYVRESPVGVYKGLRLSMIYYVYVEENAEQLAKDQLERKSRTECEDCTCTTEDRSLHKEFYESCSCLWGNPCADAYCCKDWNNRYAIATKNGWKGF